MIETSEIEKYIQESLSTETGEPFNKFSKKTRTEMSLDSLNTINLLNREIELHKHELVIENYKVVRLDDVEDDIHDYCWVYNEWVGLKGKYEKNKGEERSSCVGKHKLLKGFIPDDDYNELVRVWNLNNYVQSK